MTIPKKKDNSSKTPSAKEVQVKAVAAYPIAATLAKKDAATPPVSGQIVKMVEHGFLVKTAAGPLFKVSDEWTVQFEFPVTHVKVESGCVVVKTYDSFDSQSSSQSSPPVVLQNNQTNSAQKLYIIELHFKNLSTVQRKSIEDYLVASGQKKRVNI